MRGAAVLLLTIALGASAAPPLPTIERATRGERCVEDTATMRRQHMDFLDHQRDATVRSGVRGAKHSLKDCIGCHASAKTGSVAAAPGDFCVSCHSYAAVKIDCFDCHSPKRVAEVRR